MLVSGFVKYAGKGAGKIDQVEEVFKDQRVLHGASLEMSAIRQDLFGNLLR